MQNKIYSAILITLTCMACKKSVIPNGQTTNRANQGNQTTQSLVKNVMLIVYDTTSGAAIDSSISTMQYDASNRISKSTLNSYVINSGNPSFFSVDNLAYTYSAQLVTVNGATTLSSSTVANTLVTGYYLNASGQADSSITSITTAGGLATENQVTHYTYDGNGYLISQSSKAALVSGAQTIPLTSAVTTYTIANGNTVAVATTMTLLTGGDKVTQSNVTYTYGNQPDNGYVLPNVTEAGYLGHRNADLATSITTANVTYYLTYAFDNQGQLIESTEKTASGQLVLKMEVTY